MKKLLFVLLAGLPLFVSAQSAYEKEIAAYREAYKVDFIKEERSPLKGNDTAFLRFFPVNEQYKVQAKITLLPDAPAFDMETHSGKKQRYKPYARTQFRLNGKQCVLFLYQNLSLIAKAEHQEDLFLPFNDLTNYESTYGGGRYLDLRIADIRNGEIGLDFNKCYNPYCAFKGGYSCPIPPAENRLNIKIEAGEKLFGKEVAE